MADAALVKWRKGEASDQEVLDAYDALAALKSKVIGESRHEFAQETVMAAQPNPRSAAEEYMRAIDHCERAARNLKEK